MARQLTTLLMTAALASCGSKPTPTTTPTDQAPMGSGSAMGSAMGSDMTGMDMPTPVDKPPAKPMAPAPDPEKVKAELLAVEMSAYEKAKPSFDKYCAGCHTKSGKKAAKKKLDHVDMTTYPFGGMHTKSIGNEIRVVLAIDGGTATMPFDKPGSVKGDDLALITAWTEAWRAAGKGGVHPAEPADKD